jgi:hypothetical protein
LEKLVARQAADLSPILYSTKVFFGFQDGCVCVFGEMRITYYKENGERLFKNQPLFVSQLPTRVLPLRNLALITCFNGGQASQQADADEAHFSSPMSQLLQLF